MITSLGSTHSTFAADLEMPLIGSQTSISSPGELVKTIFIYGLGMVGIVALFSIAFGGFHYIFGSASETAKTEGKKWIYGAIAGIVLLFSSYLILKTISPDLVSLKDPHLEVIFIPKTVDNYIPSEVGYRTPVIGSISSTLQNLSQYQGQLNAGNTQVIIDKSDHAMYIYKDGQLIGQAPINIGTNDQSGTQIGGVSGDKITPVGDFTITNDVRYNAGGVYSGQYGSNMGPAFLGLSATDQNGSYRGIGIHGSSDDSLGSTYGCIRVQNADIISLYQTLQPGTAVKIRN